MAFIEIRERPNIQSSDVAAQQIKHKKWHPVEEKE